MAWSYLLDGNIRQTPNSTEVIENWQVVCIRDQHKFMWEERAGVFVGLGIPVKSPKPP